MLPVRVDSSAHSRPEDLPQILLHNTGIHKLINSNSEKF